jgi:isopenicillin-N epimerase
MTDVANEWSFPPGTTYLNHGSFGPSPRCVQEAREELQRRLEAQPMDFFLRQLPPLFISARARLASFVGAEPEDLIFVDNSTVGMNVVAASIDLRPGDEVLANDHEYGAVLRLWERKCQAAGARFIVQRLPSPLRGVEEVVEAILAAASPRTRLLVFSHVTSPTAVIFPAAEICRQARRRGIGVCIDGPHAVAMLPLELRSLDCDFYTASCHKWLSAPFGSGFLYVHPRRQASVRPAIVSWGRTLEGDQPGWRDEFHWLGTRDTTAWLSVPAAIDFLEHAGLDDFRRQTHELAGYARRRIEELTSAMAAAAEPGSLDPLVPDDPACYGSMAAMPLPPGEAEPLQRALWEKHGIEAPVIDWSGRRLIRVSCHLYNTQADVDRLVDALTEEMRH